MANRRPLQHPHTDKLAILPSFNLRTRLPPLEEVWRTSSQLSVSSSAQYHSALRHQAIAIDH